MSRGYFITLEGPDGSGKSTQTAFLKQYFLKKEMDTVFTREPGGTEIGEKIRKIILDKNNMEMCDMAEALLYAASRAQHVNQIIKPAIEAGKVVICDRFIDSSIAYQGYGRGLGDSVRVINEYAIDGFMPDITFFMRLDPKVGIGRINDGDQDRLEMEKLEFHNRVFEGYLELEARYPDRFISIDGNRTAEEIRDDLYSKLDAFFIS